MRDQVNSAGKQQCRPIRSPHPHGEGEKDKYLQDIFYSDVHLKILLTVSLQPVIGEAIIIWCSKQITVYQESRR